MSINAGTMLLLWKEREHSANEGEASVKLHALLLLLLLHQCQQLFGSWSWNFNVKEHVNHQLALCCRTWLINCERVLYDSFQDGLTCWHSESFCLAAGMCRTKDKSKPNKPAASPEVGPGAPLQPPHSAKSDPHSRSGEFWGWAGSPASSDTCPCCSAPVCWCFH